MRYRFFFSYARETYKASKIHHGNLVDQFFDDLTNRVALLTGERVDEVAYRDVDRLRLSDDWGPALIEAMQDSAVLVCVMSPHYLRSLPCGREVQFFSERFALLKGAEGGDKHRILPVFWVDEVHCHQHMHPHVKEFLKTLNLTQKGLPSEYPRVGISHSYGQGRSEDCYIISSHLAQRITELSALSALPRLEGGLDFNGLPSFFERREGHRDEQLAVGPLGTNVVYVVATADMVGGDPAAATYGEKAEEWRPFEDKPKRTISLLTQSALTDAGQRDTEYHAMTLSENLLPKIRKARECNSPVLIVLDQASLRFEAIKKPLADYDSYDAPHIGLVTAGGLPANEPLLRDVFATKYLGSRPYHLWTVPPTSEAYEHSVADVVSALRTGLQKISRPTVALSPSPMPSLTQPGA